MKARADIWLLFLKFDDSVYRNQTAVKLACLLLRVLHKIKIHNKPDFTLLRNLFLNFVTRKMRRACVSTLTVRRFNKIPARESGLEDQ